MFFLIESNIFINNPSNQPRTIPLDKSLNKPLDINPKIIEIEDYNIKDSSKIKNHDYDKNLFSGVFGKSRENKKIVSKSILNKNIFI